MKTSRWLGGLAFALMATAAHALPSYGIFQTQVDANGSDVWGYYFVPPVSSGSYIWMYDGSVGIPSSNPMKMAAIGTGLTWNGTTLTATQPAARSFSYTTRSLNSCFQVSSTRDAAVSYAVEIAATISLTAGQQGTVYLRTYSNSSCTTGTQELTRFVNGNTGTLTIGLALTQTASGVLSGVVPAGSYVQLVTENNSGAPGFTARPGQEVLL